MENHDEKIRFFYTNLLLTVRKGQYIGTPNIS